MGPAATRPDPVPKSVGAAQSAEDVCVPPIGLGVLPFLAVNWRSQPAMLYAWAPARSHWQAGGLSPAASAQSGAQRPRDMAS